MYPCSNTKHLAISSMHFHHFVVASSYILLSPTLFIHPLPKISAPNRLLPVAPCQMLSPSHKGHSQNFALGQVFLMQLMNYKDCVCYTLPSYETELHAANFHNIPYLTLPPITLSRTFIACSSSSSSSSSIFNNESAPYGLYIVR